MKQAELAFKSFLSARKLKYTPERRKILEEIFAAGDLFDAEQLLLRLKKHNKRVSRATVYRTLELLARLGLVNRVCFSERTSFYENTTNGQHNGRLFCQSCGKIEQFSTEGIDELIETACRENDFIAQNRCIRIAGYCRDCNDRQAHPNSNLN